LKPLESVKPMDREIAKELRALFDSHDEMFAKLRETTRQIGEANEALGAAIQAHDGVIQAAMRANQAALAILAKLEA
jgi:hypothetical protein